MLKVSIKLLLQPVETWRGFFYSCTFWIFLFCFQLIIIRLDWVIYHMEALTFVTRTTLKKNLNVPVSRKTGLNVFDETLMRSEWNFFGKLQKISKNQKKIEKNSENFFLILFLVILLSKLVFNLFNLLSLSNCRIFIFFLRSSQHTVWRCNATFVFFLSRKLVILFSWWEVCFRERRCWRDPSILVEANLIERRGT